MKLTKDEFFSLLENGEINNFIINGNKYFSSKSDFNVKKYEERMISELRDFLSKFKTNNMFKPIKKNLDKQELYKLFREIDLENYYSFVDLDTLQYGIEFPTKDKNKGSVSLVSAADGSLGLLFSAYDGDLDFTDYDLQFENKLLKFIFPLIVQSILK